MIDNEIVITKLNNRPMFFYLNENKLQYLEVLEEDSFIGRIFVGRVENIVSNINSAFVKFQENQNGYLSLKDVEACCILNRDYNLKPQLKSGDLVLVQVSNDALKTKLPKLTCKISISGSLSAITIGERGVGCSRKLPEDKRSELINAVKDADKESRKSESCATFNYGIIIRTDAGKSDIGINDILLDVNKLKNDMYDIFHKASFLSKCQEIIVNNTQSKVIDITKRFIHVSQAFSKTDILINTDIKEVYDEINTLDNEAGISVKYHDLFSENASSLSVVYGLENKLDECTKKKVWLKSGGYLVIEQTEALNVIDVNTGKSISGKNNIIEKLNLEAMEESMRQIRLRNLSGMILIDFINMKSKDENNHLIDNIKAISKLDPLNINFVDITGLGIIELTRKKTGKSLLEVLTK